MHIFTCSCGQTFPISPARAGQSVDCPHCGQAVSLPKLGEIKQLPLADAGQKSDSDANKWNAGRGITFSMLMAGLLATIIFGGYSSYQWLSIEKPPTEDEMISMGQAELETREPLELFEFWINYGRPGMGTRHTPGYMQVQRYRDKWKFRAIASYAGVAIFLVAVTAVSRRKTPDRNASAF